MNPFIPTHTPKQADGGLRRVRFIRQGNEVILQDDRGQKFNLDLVELAPYAFGYEQEGLVKEPRVWVVDETGRETVQGDWYVMAQLPGGWIILGAIRKLMASELFAAGQGQNPAVLTMVTYDAAGNRTGKLEVTVNAKTNTKGDLTVRTDEGVMLEMEQGGKMKFNGGGKAIALGPTVDSQFKALADIFSTWVPIPNDGGAALKTLLTGLITSGWPSTTGSNSVESG